MAYMTAVIYARYSSNSQREESIEGQIRECRAFAEKNGYTIIHNYMDRAISGKTDDRPQFQKMIADVAAATGESGSDMNCLGAPKKRKACAFLFFLVLAHSRAPSYILSRQGENRKKGDITMESLWKQVGAVPHFPALQRDLDTDVLIIGGGIAGILCAHKLQAAGVDYALVEASQPCSGTTGYTTAKITVQHGLIYGKLGKKAPLYYAANQQALEEYARLCQNVDCDFTPQDAYVFSRTDRQKLEKEVRALEQLGAPVELVRETELPFPVEGAVKLSGQAQFHPLKFLGAISKELHIFANTPVQQLVGTTALTDHGTIRARRVVIATHFPILNKHGSYFMKMYQHRSYVLALEGMQKLQGMYVEDTKTGLSFRSFGDTLLLGGGGHRTGKPGGSWQVLRNFAKVYYPHAREVCHWAAQDCMTLDNIPYVGRYSAGTQGLYVATGFHKWGMTGAMAAAGVLADLLQGKESPYETLFSPSRSMLHPQLAANTGHALAGWLHLTRPRCPHLGCALNWNPQEHSWDCSCHGSRFAQDGQLLEGPATGDLTNME